MNEKTMNAETASQAENPALGGVGLNRLLGVLRWNHTCGWSGTERELVIEMWKGIVCGTSCPKCGDGWPVLFDEWDEEVVDGDHEWKPTNRDQNRESLSKRLRMWS